MSIKKQEIKNKPESKVTFKLGNGMLPESTEQVFLVAEFNNWTENALPLKKAKDGSFSVSLNLPTGTEYQFRYLVNGIIWVNDEAADKYIPNLIDGDNSVVVL